MMMNLFYKYPKNIIVDSCFWIAYFDSNDNNHDDARGWSDIIFNYHVLCPFPTLYEFLRTKFSRKKGLVIELEKLLKKKVMELIFDDNYRKNILSDFVESNRYFSQFSLVDMVINRMLDDVNLKIDYLFTYNNKDFLSMCSKRNIEIIPE